MDLKGVFKGFQDYTKVYNGAGVHKGLQVYTMAYGGIQGCTCVFKGT